MTTENDFQRALDADPGDAHTRLVFADWLQDHGDLRAEGYRALGVMRRNPLQDSNTAAQWRWYSVDLGADPPGPDDLPDDWLKALGPRVIHGTSARYDTRREAEDAAALAFALLPAERRAELLTGTESG